MADRITMKNRLAELKALPNEGLLTAVEEARRNIYLIRRQKISMDVPNKKAIHNNRKHIARALTIMRQREIAAEKQSK